MRSLRGRFAVVAVVTALATAGALGAAMQGLFESHVEREKLSELDADLRLLARELVAGADAPPRLADPRFQEPLSGLYWQVRDERSGAVRRSPSLAGFELPFRPDTLHPGELHRHIVFGPGGGKMILLERRLDGPDTPFRVAIAMDRKIMEAANRAFVLDMLPALATISLGLLAAFGLQGAIALWPIRRARRALAALRAGRRDRLGGALPAELDGLAQEFDAMLDQQRQQARRARERTADLAHGLRTPLALLGARARDLRERGDAENAAAIEAIAASLEQRMTRELARAHIQAGSAAARTELAPLAARLAGAMARTPRGEALRWSSEVPAGLVLAAEPEDVTELLGCLLDNAAKWARGQVVLRASAAEGHVTLLIEDDGPGIPPQERRAALTRGGRLDPAQSGTGLGLAIAGDIAAAYGGTLGLEESSLGGLGVRVVLPA
ncbi:HAMP domain-containing histidine kinase [Rhodovarius crocodyli]|uniref:histidine kinase n=1 Tax=Rhodovarius crocodyli TaxID=1979269 RepID=A0A437MNU0_9PROT|nr:sensor histidine kinase [Rhodovarius crocodyli]RVT99315.1 HAMP domain-containing histidine kinase [Rhodovarius crocodyli]